MSYIDLINLQYHPFVNAGVISRWSIDLNNKQTGNNRLTDFSDINWDSLSALLK
jgi:hypothetical protein